MQSLKSQWTHDTGALEHPSLRVRKCFQTRYMPISFRCRRSVVPDGGLVVEALCGAYAETGGAATYVICALTSERELLLLLPFSCGVGVDQQSWRGQRDGGGDPGVWGGNGSAPGRAVCVEHMAGGQPWRETSSCTAPRVRGVALAVCDFPQPF